MNNEKGDQPYIHICTIAEDFFVPLLVWWYVGLGCRRRNQTKFSNKYQDFSTSKGKYYDVFYSYVCFVQKSSWAGWLSVLQTPRASLLNLSQVEFLFWTFCWNTIRPHRHFGDSRKEPIFNKSDLNKKQEKRLPTDESSKFY
jgi:hypothetical protein